MTFLQLYTTELDRELGSDRPELFTVTRRKAAINAALVEFNERTGCYRDRFPVPLVNGIREVDLEGSIANFLRLGKMGVSIQIESAPSSGEFRYIEGDDLELRSIAWLNETHPGWRAVAPGTPMYCYLERSGVTWMLGFYPAPGITAPEVWSALVQAVLIPTEMTTDTEEPYSQFGNAIESLRPFHRALVHFAAYDLEKYRKDVQRGGVQLQLFEQYVQRFLANEKPATGQVVRMAYPYRPMRGRARDPRIWG